jgi:hypothetical protein
MAKSRSTTSRRSVLMGAAAVPAVLASAPASAAPVPSPMSPAVAEAFARWVAMEEAVIANLLPEFDVTEAAVFKAHGEGVTGPALDALEDAHDAMKDRVSAAWDEVNDARFAVLEIPAASLSDLCLKLRAAADIRTGKDFDGSVGIERAELAFLWNDIVRLGGEA